MIKIGMLIADRYEILEKVGTGGMADVYKSKDHTLNRYVAVKVLKQEFSENANFVSKFRVEAQAAAGLMHPNIVNVYDVGEEKGIYYIVMELVDGITLKNYIAKDMSLYAGDYRAAERTFQLLTQAAGRAGRGDVPGNVVIQTYQPENYAVQYASAQDYEGFFAEEMRYRSLLLYPPAAHMLCVQLQSDNEDRAESLAGRLRELFVRDDPEVLVIGPAKGSLTKIRDQYRYVIYIKDVNYDKLVRCKKVIPVITEPTGDTNPQVQKVAGSSEVIFKTKELDEEKSTALAVALQDQFNVDKDNITSETISSTISSEMKTAAFNAVIVALVLMLAYIWFRFKDARFGASSVICLKFTGYGMHHSLMP